MAARRWSANPLAPSGGSRIENRPARSLGARPSAGHLDRLQPASRAGTERRPPLSGAVATHFQRPNLAGDRPAHDHGGIQRRQSVCGSGRACQRPWQSRQDQLRAVPPAQVVRLAHAGCQGSPAGRIARYAVYRRVRAPEPDHPAGLSAPLKAIAKLTPYRSDERKRGLSPIVPIVQPGLRLRISVRSGQHAVSESACPP